MAGSFTLGGTRFDGDRVLVIAEIGTGHGGDRGKARELIAAAAQSGADCVKFQCVFADEILHPNTGRVLLPGGSIELYERFLSLECDEDFYREAKETAEAQGLTFLCTPFGLRSSRLLRSIGCKAIKIASPELNHFPLLEEVASYGLPTILSSGVSSLSDIDRALKRFGGRRDGTGRGNAGGAATAPDLALLHCVTAYPAPSSDYNLRLLTSLGALFGLAMGVSDHSLDPVLIPALSTAMGGILVEKHICLSREDPGLDDPIAVPPVEFARMARAIRSAQELGADETLASLRMDYGPESVEAALGNGVKTLAPSEALNYGRTNRSIHARRAISAGSLLAAEDLAILRTEKTLRPGLDPELLSVAVGRLAARDIPSGEGLEWEDLGGFPQVAHSA